MTLGVRAANGTKDKERFRIVLPRHDGDVLASCGAGHCGTHWGRAGDSAAEQQGAFEEPLVEPTPPPPPPPPQPQPAPTPTRIITKMEVVLPREVTTTKTGDRCRHPTCGDASSKTGPKILTPCLTCEPLMKAPLSRSYMQEAAQLIEFCTAVISYLPSAAPSALNPKDCVLRAFVRCRGGILRFVSNLRQLAP